MPEISNIHPFGRLSSVVESLNTPTYSHPKGDAMIRWRFALQSLSMIMVSIVLFSSCAGRKAVFLDVAGEREVTPEAIALREQADALWEERGNPQKARQMLELYIKAAQADPTNMELWTRLARAYFIVADYIEQDEKKRDELYLKGVEAGERALGLHPGFREIYERSKNEREAVNGVGIEGISALQWTQANLSKWAANKSLLVRLGNRPKLEAYNRRIMELDESYFYGAPHRFFGGLQTRIPGGDMELSRQHFEKAIEIEPNYFGTRTLFAEFYATKVQDRETFIAQLQYVLNTPYDVLPEVAAENKYEQERAKRLLEKVDEWFR